MEWQQTKRKTNKHIYIEREIYYLHTIQTASQNLRFRLMTGKKILSDEYNNTLPLELPVIPTRAFSILEMMKSFIIPNN